MKTTLSLDAEYEKFARALFLDHLPCNPVPFRNACDRYVANGGDPTSDTFKAMAWMVLAIQEGQLAVVDISDIYQQGWYELRRAYPGAKPLDLHKEWERLNVVFNPPKKVKAVVSILAGPRSLSEFISKAGLGITGAGTRSTITIDYKPGEVVDEARVKKAMDYMIQGLDETKDELKILSYEVLKIYEEA